MRGVLARIIDIIAPRRARVINIDRYSAADLIADTASTQAGAIEIVSLASYKTPAVEDCIRALKYDGDARAASLLSLLLAGYLSEELSSQRAFTTRASILMPVPLHSQRATARGFNQVTRVLEALPPPLRDGTIASIVRDALVRTRDTPSQTRLSREERRQNVEGAFKLTSPCPGSHVYLIDDVVTTGATLAAAAAPLLAAGVPTHCIALARA